MCNDFTRDPLEYKTSEHMTYGPTTGWKKYPVSKDAEIEILNIEIKRLQKENKRQEELLKVSYAREAEVNQLREFLFKSDPKLDLSNGTINTAIKEIGNAKASILILQTELAILKNSQKA